MAIGYVGIMSSFSCEYLPCSDSPVFSQPQSKCSRERKPWQWPAAPSLPCSTAWGAHRWHSEAPFWPWLYYTLAQLQSLGTSSAKGGPGASPKTLFLPLPPQSMEPQAILKRQGVKTVSMGPREKQPWLQNKQTFQSIWYNGRQETHFILPRQSERSATKGVFFSSSSSSRTKADLTVRQPPFFWHLSWFPARNNYIVRSLHFTTSLFLLLP